MKVIKFAPGLIPVFKHQQHDQSSHGNWAHGSSFGDFTLEEGADSKKLAVYSHPNGTRVIFQNLSKVESDSPMVKETLEIVSDLSKKYPVPNLTFVVQSGEGGGIITRGYDGIAYCPANTDEPERIQAWLDYKKMPAATDPNAPYIAIRQRVIAPDSVPRVTRIGAGGIIRPEKTQEQKTAYLKELITHEWGHALDTRSQAVSDAQFRNRDKNSTSTYGNKNGREFFAETFAASELGGLIKDKPDSIPNYKKAAEYLEIDSIKAKVSKESFEGFIVYENFETEEPLLIEGGTPLDFDEPFTKHQEHDQSSHGNWADGSQGSSSELSDDEIKDIIYNSATVNEMFQKVAERLGKSMKPKVADLSEEEINFFRGVTDVNRDAQRLVDGRIPFTPFQTWGQGIYISSEPEYAQAYGDLIRLKLDDSVKLVEGEIAWMKAFEQDIDSSIDKPRLLERITAGKMDNLSDSDMQNIYWAAKGYDGYSVYRYGRAEVVLFNADKLTVNKADMGEAVQKHQEHDQSSHGNWADGSSESGLDAMPYEWKPEFKERERLTASELSSEEVNLGREQLKQIASTGAITIRVSSGDLELRKIVEAGGFKSLTEMPEPTLDYSIRYKEARYDLEKGLWGQPESADSPIYGYFDSPLHKGVDNMTRMYGDVKIILKDSVAGRTTITPGDSLTHGLTPVLVTDARKGNLSPEHVDSAYRSRHFQRGSTSVSQPLRSIRPIGFEIDYFEAQVHGKVTLSDIKSVRLGKYSIVGDETIALLEKAGIEVTRDDK
jgi:hypothetical protein